VSCTINVEKPTKIEIVAVFVVFTKFTENEFRQHHPIMIDNQ